MNVILLGPPGAGKGTQGELLARRLGMPRVATGDLLRDAVRRGTALGAKAKSFMDKGLLVPDAVIVGLVDAVLERPDTRGGIIMDGFPRTVPQAEAVDRALARRGAHVHYVVRIEVPQAELVRRLVRRAEQEGRSDDTPETIEERLRVYREETAPLVDYYRSRDLVVDIDGTGSIDEIAARIDEALDR